MAPQPGCWVLLIQFLTGQAERTKILLGFFCFFSQFIYHIRCCHTSFKQTAQWQSNQCRSESTCSTMKCGTLSTDPHWPKQITEHTINIAIKRVWRSTSQPNVENKVFTFTKFLYITWYMCQYSSKQDIFKLNHTDWKKFKVQQKWTKKNKQTNKTELTT